MLPVAVFDPHELRESALRHKLAAQVPLAVVRAGVIVGHALGHRQMFGFQQVVVLDAACRVRVETGHDGRARGRAHGLRAVGALDHKAVLSQAVQVRRLDGGVAVAGQGVGPLLIREDMKSKFGFSITVGLPSLVVPARRPRLPPRTGLAFVCVADTGAACASASAGRLRGCLCTLGVLLRLPLLAQAGVFFVGEIASALRTRSGKRVILEGAFGVAATCKQ